MRKLRCLIPAGLSFGFLIIGCQVMAQADSTETGPSIDITKKELPARASLIKRSYYREFFMRKLPFEKSAVMRYHQNNLSKKPLPGILYLAGSTLISYIGDKTNHPYVYPVNY